MKIQMFIMISLKVHIIHPYSWIAIKLKDPLVEWWAISIKEQWKRQNNLCCSNFEESTGKIIKVEQWHIEPCNEC